ncbi:MAG: hypothetical protein A2Z34_01365 [Planctomycetes bacterium RBG_16_59_8]|nr:MAG: hypothetical protein A2Z34_01365 [Planctomycetes bacterium RBG_16_59_8]
MRQMRKRAVNEGISGSALLLVTILISTLMLISGAIVTQVVSRSQLSESLNYHVTSFYAADAGLEEGEYNIRTSSYNTEGNVWLNNNSAADGFPAITDLPIGNAVVDVVITDNGDSWHTIVSTATLPDGTKSSVAVQTKGRDNFSKYMFFIDLDSINIGTTTVRGDVHANRNVNFYYGGAKMYGNVTAVRGVGYYSGASQANTTFYKEVDGAVDQIAWPNVNDIATLHDTAEGVYQVSNTSAEYSGLGSFNTEITFNGDQVTITAKRASNGQVLKTGTYPLPPNNLIFVQGAVTSLKGDINGRVTVATMNKVDITGKVRYVDQDGDPAYRLTNAAGTPIDTASTGTNVWASPNYNYQLNPDYNPSTPSTLGIMSLMDITITPTAPYNTEMHAATFSYNGNWHCDLTQAKGNLRVLGSMTQKLGGWRYNSAGKGWAKSGEYIYDQNLMTNPPPHFLQVDSPVFASWRKMQ